MKSVYKIIEVEEHKLYGMEPEERVVAHGRTPQEAVRIMKERFSEFIAAKVVGDKDNWNISVEELECVAEQKDGLCKMTMKIS